MLRKDIQGLRNKLTEKEILVKGTKVHGLLNSLLSSSLAENYMCYVSIRSEVRTVEVIKQLIEENKNISVPVCIPETTQLFASQIFRMEELAPSQFGLLEPKSDFMRPIEPEKLEIVLVPGLAFDRKGNRLGYGKGYYDGFLTKVSPRTLKIGLAYSFQIVEKVPIDSLDIPLDIIITEKEIINC